MKMELRMKEEIELIAARAVKEMASVGDEAGLVMSIDGGGGVKFIDADDILAEACEYVEAHAGDYESPEAAEEFFWSSVSISKRDNYIKTVITAASQYNCIELVARTTEKKPGFALLYPERLFSRFDDRDLLEKELEASLPEAAEQALFYWKNGWDDVEHRGATNASDITEAISSDVFSDDDSDWLEENGIDTSYQGIRYDSTTFRLGWFVPSADSCAYC